MKIQEHSHNSQQGNSAEGGDQGRQDDTGIQQQPKILCVGGSLCVCVCVLVCVCVSFFFICSHITKASVHPRATYFSPFILSFG